MIDQQTDDEKELEQEEFDKKTQMALTDKIKEVNENAIRITEIA